jgi:polyphosphate:AMP phosphotransferase
MFEAAELGRTVSKEDYRAEVAGLRWQLLDAQRQLRSAPFPLIVVFGGVDGAGKSETVHLLNEWMDPRWIVARAFDEPSDEERERPSQWRFWRDLPGRGEIGLFLSSWYSAPILDRVHRRSRPGELDDAARRIAAFERLLTDDGALIVKFWMHLSKRVQKRRLRELEDDPLTRWRVTKQQWKHWKLYARFTAAAERVIRQTSTGAAPWIVVEGADERYRSLVVGTTIRDVLYRSFAALQQTRRQTTRSGAAPATGSRSTRRSLGRRKRDPSVLTTLDMTQSIPDARFDRLLLKWQGRLNVLQRRALRRRVSTILVFEGWDAAGKGGAIRRVTSALDLRECRVIPFAAPTDEERAHHYLWRFWRHLGRAGRATIYDRSWYGRVLVERVEGFATEPEWRRAYAEINEFEDQLVEHGIVLVKYWLHITKDEQLKRFEERAKSPYKSWKLGDDDWRNREKWDEYEQAVDDMVAQTSTRRAPWILVPANDKNFARIEILRAACKALDSRLQRLK